jgi:hypothetical protein
MCSSLTMTLFSLLLLLYDKSQLNNDKILCILPRQRMVLMMGYFTTQKCYHSLKLHFEDHNSICRTLTCLPSIFVVLYSLKISVKMCAEFDAEALTAGISASGTIFSTSSSVLPLQATLRRSHH